MNQPSNHSFSDLREALCSLLKTHAVLRGEFVLSSGKKSDTYVDVRRAILRSDGIALAGRALYEMLAKDDDSIRFAGGLALGAVPLTTAISYAAALAGVGDFTNVIVRKEAKGHGTSSQIEPAIEVTPGSKLAVIDDVITTAGSTLRAVAVLREAGFVINDAYAVVDRKAGGREALKAEGIELHALFTLDELLEQ